MSTIIRRKSTYNLLCASILTTVLFVVVAKMRGFANSKDTWSLRNVTNEDLGTFNTYSILLIFIL